MAKEYKKGVPITSLDQLMKQEQVLFIPLNKVFSYGWFASWQMQYALSLIKGRALYTVEKSET